MGDRARDGEGRGVVRWEPEGLLNRAEVWLYRRLRPVVVGGADVLPRLRKVAAGAALAAVLAGGAVGFGFHQGYEAAETETAEIRAPEDLGGMPGAMEDLCRARAEAAVVELAREEGVDPDEGIAALLVGRSEIQECRAEAALDAAELRARAMSDLVAAEAKSAREAGPGE